MRETWVRPRGREDALETGMAAHPSILAWGIHGWRCLGGLIPVPGVAESDKEQFTRSRSRRGMAETNTMLENNSSPTKNT